MDNTSINGISKSLEALYFKGDFKQARELVLEAKSSIDPGLFHYNLGTLFAKEDVLGAGRYHLEKALLEGYEPTRSLNNIAYIKSKLLLPDLSSTNVMQETIFSYLINFPFEAYACLALLVFLLCWLFLKSTRLFSLKPLIFSLCLSLVPLLFYSSVIEGKKVVVIIKETSIKDGPSGIFEDIGKLEEGLKVVVSENSDHYYFVKMPAVHAGWIKKDSFLEL